MTVRTSETVVFARSAAAGLLDLSGGTSGSSSKPAGSGASSQRAASPSQRARQSAGSRSGTASCAIASHVSVQTPGSIHEGAHLGAGLSHFLEHMLFKGT